MAKGFTSNWKDLETPSSENADPRFYTCRIPLLFLVQYEAIQIQT